MNTPRSLSRRRLLRNCGAVVALGALAGCVGGDDSGSDESGGDDSEDDSDDSEGDSGNSEDDSDDSEGDNSNSSTGDGDDSGDDGAGDGNRLDLQEANVVGVSFDSQDGASQFDVALHHDDNGEKGYANWWQVERLDGTRLGRRELLHAHSQQPFTRSETIAVPDGVDCVVVRGHDQTHEYGGRAAVVALDSGETRIIDQGSSRKSFDASDCPS